MQRLPYLAAIAALAWAGTACAEPEVHVITTGSDEAGTGAAVSVTGVSGEGDARVQVAKPPMVVARPPVKVKVRGPHRMTLPYLGVATSTASGALRKQVGLAAGTGLVVDYVDEEGPAHEAGVRTHDVLTRLDDQILVNPPQLAVLVRMQEAGDTVTLTLVREGKERRVSATLVEKEQTVYAEGRDRPWVGGVVPPVSPKSVEELMEQGRRLIELRHGKEPQGGTVATTFSVVMADGEHTLQVTAKDGKRHLTAKDADGNVLFEGPVSTEAERAEVPPEIRDKLDRMEPKIEIRTRLESLREDAEGRKAVAKKRRDAVRKEIERKVERHTKDRPEARPKGKARAQGGAHAKVHISDDEHDIRYTATESGTHLVAKDAKGRVLFDGPIDTDEQFQKVPEAVRKKVEGIQLEVEASGTAM